MSKKSNKKTMQEDTDKVFAYNPIQWYPRSYG